MGAATALDLVPDAVGGFPVAVKPARQGSALGLRRVDSTEGLADALLSALSFDTSALVEKWIDGIELAVSVLGEGQHTLVLPAVEIVRRRRGCSTSRRAPRPGTPTSSPPRASPPRPPRGSRGSRAKCTRRSAAAT